MAIAITITDCLIITKIKPQKQTIVIKREDDTVTAYMGKHKAEEMKNELS